MIKGLLSGRSEVRILSWTVLGRLAVWLDSSPAFFISTEIETYNLANESPLPLAALLTEEVIFLIGPEVPSANIGGRLS